MLDAPRMRPGVGASGALVRASAHAFLASVFGVLIGVATSVVISRSLGPEQKGAFDLLLSTAVLLALLLGFSMPSGVTFAVARGASGARALAGWIVGLGILQAAVAAAVLAVISRTDLATSLGLTSTDAASLGVLAGLVAVLCVAPCFRAILVGNQEVELASWLELLGRALALLVLVGAILYAARDGATADGLVAATLAGSCVAAALYVPAVLRAGSRLGAGMRTVVRFATPSFGSNVVQHLNYRFDLFLVAYFRDLREVGLYALAATLAQLLWLVSRAVATAVFARVGSARDDPWESARRTAVLSRGVLAIQLLLAAALAIVAKPLVDVLYGAAFAPAVTAIWLLLPGVAVFGTTGVIAAHLAGLGRPGLNLAASAIGLVVTIALDLLLIPAFGMQGAAIASTASYASVSVLLAVLFSRLTGVPVAHVLVVRRSDVSRVAVGVRAAFR